MHQFNLYVQLELWCALEYCAAGQERFRTLTGSYYRGAQGIILGNAKIMSQFVCQPLKLERNNSNLTLLFLVYDVTRRETFTNLSDVWTKELELYSTNKDCIKMLVGNKVDKVLVPLFVSFFSYFLLIFLWFNVNNSHSNKKFVWLCGFLASCAHVLI